MKRMAVRIAGTDLGVIIDVDPSQSIEHNKEVAIKAAERLMAPYSTSLLGLKFHGVKLSGKEFIAGELPYKPIPVPEEE